MKSFKYLSMFVMVLFGLTNVAQAKHQMTDGEIIATLNAINSQEISEANLALEKNVNDKVKDYAKLMIDLQVVAYQTDLTRVVTFAMEHEGGGRVGVGAAAELVSPRYALSSRT